MDDIKMAQTADLVKLDGLAKYSPIRKLVKKLSIPTTMNESSTKMSIMAYGKICKHNTGFLCEHRLQAIIDYLKITTEEE